MKYNDIKKDNFLIVSFFLFPFFLIFSRFLSDLYISILSIIFISLIIIKKYEIKNNIYTYYLYFFYIYLLFNSAFSFEPTISFYKSFFYFRLIFFSIFVSYLINRDKGIIVIIVYSFFVSHSLLLASAFYEFIFYKNIISGRISGFFGDELILGGYISKTLPIILSLIYLDKKKFSKNLEYYLILVSLIMVVLSAERTALANIIIILFVYGILTLTKKKNLIITIVILLAGFFYNSQNPKTFQRLFTHTVEQLEYNTKYKIAPSFRHQLHWETAVNLFLDRKYLGQGLYSFRNLCDDKRFIPIETITNLNKFFAPIDGIFKHEILFNAPTAIGIDGEIKRYLVDNGERQEVINKYIMGHIFSLHELNVPVKKGEYLFSTYEFKNGCNTHPHNIHLQFLSELGIVGYMFLIFFFLYLSLLIIKDLFKKIYLKKQVNLSLFYSSLGLVLFLFPLLPSGSFFNNWISIIFYFNLSTFLYNKTYLRS